ncbi:MAG: molecular chaperone DnaJ [Candidatus Nanopelagicales bacterium]
MATDYYALLGIGRDAEPDEVKRAYRKLARELHPDVNPDPETHEKFKDVTAAYEVLSDPEKRQMYDLGGDPLRASGAPGFGGGFDFGDIMDAFFGGGAQRGPRSRSRRGQDALIRIELDLRDTMFGVERDITVDTAMQCDACSGAGTAPGTEPETCPMCKGRGEIQQVQRSFLGQVMTARACPQCQGFGYNIPHPCVECSGDGRVRTRRTIAVKIPAGVDTGTRIQLTGQGEVGPGGGQAGDLYVEIVERSHPVYERRGDDLHCTVDVPMTAAALGSSLTLETMDGEESVRIEPGTQPGHISTLRARGVPRLRGTGRGDLHIHFNVTTPTRLDAGQIDLLEQLATQRGESGATLTVTQTEDEHGGLFSRIKDAFSSKP